MLAFLTPPRVNNGYYYLYLSPILQMILELPSKYKTQPGWITVQLKIYKGTSTEKKFGRFSPKIY